MGLFFLAAVQVGGYVSVLKTIPVILVLLLWARLLTWVDRHPRCRMLVYYQDFGSSSPYRIQNYPSSLSVLRRWLHSPHIPHFAPFPPKKPPPPPGGLAPKR